MQDRISFYVAWALLNVVVATRVNTIVTEPYMDEPFHAPQAQAYCMGDWAVWDPKITTPPGLYVTSVVLKWTLLCGCSLAELRLTNLLFLLLLPLVTTHLISNLKRVPKSNFLTTPSLESLIVSSFPIAWFFAFLYYTDLGSLVLVLLAIFAGHRRNHWLAALLGLLGCTFRQTNIIWTFYAFASATLDRLNDQPGGDERTGHPIGRRSLLHSSFETVASWRPHLPLIIIDSIPYGLACAVFGCFVFWNGGIVLGDKSNHVATLHIPQLYYFVAFSTIIGFPALISGREGPGNLVRQIIGRMIGTKWRVLQTVAIIILIVLSIHNYTIHHPFLLSDNRHYTFYVWRRVFLLHPMIPYIFAPGYLICGWALFLRLRESNSLLHILLLLGCICPILLPTPLLEPRYFLVPYFLLRTRISQPPNLKALLPEALWYGAINGVTLLVFLFREREGVGRFMW